MALRIAVCHALRLIAVAALGACGFGLEARGAAAAAEHSLPEPRLETVAVVSDRAPVKAGGQVVATVEKGRMFGVLSRRGNEVEIQVCVGSEIRRGSLHTSDVKFLTDDDVDLAAEWLKMAKDLDPKVDLPAYRTELYALVERVAAAAAAGKTPREKARLIGVQLFDREGFSFAEERRPDRLLDLKKGSCFGFSFLYLRIARRLKMPLYLVMAPEHVFVRYDDGRERFNIETTQEGALHDSDDYLQEHIGVDRFRQVCGMDLVSLPSPRAHGVLLWNWGVALAWMRRYAKACEKFAKAVEINPRDAAAYSHWGVALRDMGKSPEACEKFAKAVDINPRDAEAYFEWGVALADTDRQAEASEKYAKAVGIEPGFALAHFAWGSALSAMDRPEEACEKYAAAVEAEPLGMMAIPAYHNWSILLQRMGKYAEACEMWAKAVDIGPRSEVAYIEWGVALVEMAKYAEACERFAEAVEIEPGDAKAHLYWGAALASLGRNAEAMEKLDKAAELDPALKPKVETLRKALGGK